MGEGEYMSKRLEQYFYLVLGSTLLTLGIWLFVTPNQINFGGMIGLAQLIDYFIHKFLVLPKSLNTLGMINLLMNIPLFIFGYKIMNKEFCFKTIISLIIQTVLLSILPAIKEPIVEDALLNVAFAAIICGIGVGLALRSSGCCGGIDIATVCLVKKNPDFKAGQLSIIFNVVLFGICLFIYDIKIIMYSIIGVVILAVVLAGLLIYSKSLSDEVKEGTMSLEQMANIAGNSTENTESASTEIGKSVEESKNETNSSNQTTNSQNNTNNAATNNSNTNSNVVEGTYLIEGDTEVTVDQMVAYFEASKKAYPEDVMRKGGAATIRDFCQIYYEEAVAEGIKAEVAFVQAMKETGWLQFTGAVKAEQYNFAGMGATGNSVSGESFKDVREGVRAQIQHLKAYGSTKSLNQTCVDNRFKYVERGSAIYVEWLSIPNNPKKKGWAAAKGYGVDIVKMIQKLKKM